MLDTHCNPEVCGGLYAEGSGAREDAIVKLSEMDQATPRLLMPELTALGKG